MREEEGGEEREQNGEDDGWKRGEGGKIGKGRKRKDKRKEMHKVKL